MKESDFKEMLDILIYATEKENIEIIKALLKDFDNFANEEKGLLLHVLSFSLTDANYEFVSKIIYLLTAKQPQSVWSLIFAPN